MTKPRVYFIGNTHIDHTWLWNWTEGYDEVKASWQSALDRMDEFPEFVFTASSTLHYRWLEEHEPAIFAQIRRRVREGRWQLAGGWVVQPDNNIPSGESFCRLGLYGQRYFHSRFGRLAKTGYCVDSFGHHGQVPQLLRLQGMTGWLHFRPEPAELKLPEGPYRWRGIDGSEVVACRPPGWYCSGNRQELFQRAEVALPGAVAAYPETPFFFGVGDHGGGPTIKDLKYMREYARTHPHLDCRHGGLDEFFARAAGRDLPLVRGELQYCFRGCYTTNSTTKSLNRRCESRLGQAEWLASLAAMTAGEPYAAAELAGAWDQLLTNQFHDVLCGTCTPAAMDEAHFRFGAVLESAGRLRHFASKRIAERFNRLAPRGYRASAAVCLHNTLARDLREPLQLNARAPGKDIFEQAVVDGDGRPVPFQRVEADYAGPKDRVGLLIMPTVPAGGATLLHVVQAAAVAPKERTDLKVRGSVMQNAFWRITFDPRGGGIRSLVDKTRGVELVPRGKRLDEYLVIRDGGDTWGTLRTRFDQVIGRFAHAKLQVLEAGPLRARVLIQRVYRRGTLNEWVMLHRGLNRIDFELELIWNDALKAVKIAFPLALTDARAFYEIPYGQLERPVNGEENPLQKWVEVRGRAGRRAYRVGLAVDSIGGADVTPLRGGAEIRLTLLRSPTFGHYSNADITLGPGRPVVDRGGPRRARMVLVAGTGDLGLPEVAGALAHPVHVSYEGAQPGATRKPFSLLRCTPGTVHVTALKRAEDGRGFIVRLVETRGRRTGVRVTGPEGYRAMAATLRPFEIQTWRWRRGARPVLCDVLERPVKAASGR
ncbi:MAG: hypothetical protein K8T26_05585 [Lentisphaerae bacterium]|nr:hypothetical protein [Lentisphaerota bacterium]